MLRASRACADFDVPVLGVNMGYLGFLTEIKQPEEWERHVDQVIGGEYWIEVRMMLNAQHVREGKVIADVDALKAATGFQPSTPLDVGIERFVAWYRDYYKV